MLNALNKLKAFNKKEQLIWNRNNVEIEKINHNIHLLLASIVVIGSFVLSIISTFLDSFSLLKIPYYLTFIISLSLLILSLNSRRKISSVLLLYLTNMVLFVFSLYGGAIVVPDSKSSLMLGFMFVFSVTVFDKMLRVNTFIVLFLIAYLFTVTPFKVPELAIMDFITIVGFAFVASVLGSYLRYLQLDNIELKRQSKVREKTDSLTGLLNKSSLLEISEEPHILNTISAVIMIDIDYFKTYNDTYGHQEGDTCLKAVSSVFKEFSDNYNINFFRYGGEEFTAIIYKNEPVLPMNICNDISDRINKLKIPHEKSPLGHVTVSIGLAKLYDSENQNFNNSLFEADQALYISKNSGRNKITLFNKAILN